jgi:hypothetical protein
MFTGQPLPGGWTVSTLPESANPPTSNARRRLASIKLAHGRIAEALGTYEAKGRK